MEEVVNMEEVFNKPSTDVQYKAEHRKKDALNIIST